MKRKLNEQQQIFLDSLEECNFNYAAASRKAGYSPNYDPYRLVLSLKDEIIERAKDYLAINSLKAAKALVDTIDDPIALGTMNKIKAATEILDRAGVNKAERVEHTVDLKNVIILPAKNAD